MNIAEVTAAYRNANKRLLFLDYDGTLVGYRKDPSKAQPTQKLLRWLEKLARDPAATVVIISGRDRPILETWLGHLPLGFAAEHGFWHKLSDGAWQGVRLDTADWKSPIRQIIERYVNPTDGMWLEEKTNAFAWHCRQVSDEARAIRLQEQLIAELSPVAKHFKLRVLSGNRVVDVYPLAFSKGTAASYWLHTGYDFVLAAGDDTTDEELFKAMPAHGFTIKVGPGQTSARLRLPSHVAMVRLLEALAKTHY